MHAEIREATAGDWPAIWPFFHRIVAAGDTFTYPPDLEADEARGWWLLEPPNRTVVAVAVDGDGTVVGTAKMNRNQAGNGGHIASASYMVDPEYGGRGIGRALVEDSLRWAKEAGYRGMQFNAVVQTNTHAVRLYEDLGFRIVGTVPDAFHHPVHGYTGLHVMYRPL
ncbi:GNAT family N-acetyltransferase [Streptomyces sp. NPDC052644]